MTAPAPTDRARRIWANRTLNLRSIQAIGYDMDYTLVHYCVEAWEGHAYRRLRDELARAGWPVADLEFDPNSMIRGLVIDAELGNIVKANRFGYVVRAAHGTRPLDYEQQRQVYRLTPVDLSDPRFQFLNTLFSLSEAHLFAQLVDLYDAGRLDGVTGYTDLLRRVREGMDRAHLEGELKAEITAHPQHFVEPDADTVRALLDQRDAGKRLLLITNSDWAYANPLMKWAFDPYLPGTVSWRDLFELVIVGARKPTFFTSELPLFRIVDDSRGLLEPVPTAFPGPGAYVGGDAARVEAYLDLNGSQILYVGDHVFADVRVSKSYLRWRTALILRELEDEVRALDAFRPTERRLVQLMQRKTALEEQACAGRLTLSRRRAGGATDDDADDNAIAERLAALREKLESLDTDIAPLARDASVVGNPIWGPLLRAGNDTSHLARQLERSADLYTSRVSNMLTVTPFAYLRAHRSGMPHDPADGDGPDPD